MLVKEWVLSVTGNAHKTNDKECVIVYTETDRKYAFVFNYRTTYVETLVWVFV